MRSTGGSRESDNRFVALRRVLQCGQCLERCQSGREKSKKLGSNQASDLSMTSSFTNASMQDCSVTLDRLEGSGSCRNMNALYVVDVYTDSSDLPLDVMIRTRLT